MASATDIVSLYLASAETNEDEGKANVSELSTRIFCVYLTNERHPIEATQIARICKNIGRILDCRGSKDTKTWYALRGIELMIALGCLSGVIASLPARTMNIQEVDVMTTFYCDRLEDEVSTTENVQGLLALQDMPGFREEEVTKVCAAYGPLFARLTEDFLMMWIWGNNYKRHEF